MKPWVRPALLALGLGLFAWFVYRAGPAEILRVLARLGWWFPVALLPYLLVYCIDTLGWRFAFEPGGQRPPFRTLLRIRWAGEAVNSVVPTGYIGGEAVKTWLLRRRGVSLAAATTSVVVSKSLQVAAQVIFIALGAGLAFAQLPTGSPARRAFAVVSVLAAIAGLLLFWIQSRGLFSFVRAIASRLRIRLLDNWQSQLRELD